MGNCCNSYKFERLLHFCRVGDIDNVIRLFDEKINLHDSHNAIFAVLCANERVDILGYLMNRSIELGNPYDIHIGNDVLFKHACVKDKRKVVEWMWGASVGLGSPFNISMDYEFLSLLMFKYKNLSIVEWLWGKSLEQGIRIDFNDEKCTIVQQAVNTRDLVVIQWLVANDILNDNFRQDLMQVVRSLAIDSTTDVVQIQCVICMANTRSVVFNCGHLCSCHRCASQIKTCPFCRKDILSRNPVFLV